MTPSMLQTLHSLVGLATTTANNFEDLADECFGAQPSPDVSRDTPDCPPCLAAEYGNELMSLDAALDRLSKAFERFAALSRKEVANAVTR